MRIQDRTVRQEYEEPQAPRKLAADPTGEVWIGLLNGDLSHYHDGRQETYRFAHDDTALVNQLQPVSDNRRGSFWRSGSVPRWAVVVSKR